MQTRHRTTGRSPTPPSDDDPLSPEERETGQTLALFLLVLFVALFAAALT
jgi:hypothetical protein